MRPNPCVSWSFLQAHRIGLCSECVPDSRALEKAALDIAVAIAQKPRVAVVGTKKILQHARDHPLQSSLDYNAVWSAAFLPNQALSRNIAAFRSKLWFVYWSLIEEQTRLFVMDPKGMILITSFLTGLCFKPSTDAILSDTNWKFPTRTVHSNE